MKEKCIGCGLSELDLQDNWDKIVGQEDSSTENFYKFCNNETFSVIITSSPHITHKEVFRLKLPDEYRIEMDLRVSVKRNSFPSFHSIDYIVRIEFYIDLFGNFKKEKTFIRKIYICKIENFGKDTIKVINERSNAVGGIVQELNFKDKINEHLENKLSYLKC